MPLGSNYHLKEGSAVGNIFIWIDTVMAARPALVQALSKGCAAWAGAPARTHPAQKCAPLGRG